MAASQEMDINMIYLNHHATTITASAVRSTVTAFWFQTHFQRHTMSARVLLIYHLHPVFPRYLLSGYCVKRLLRMLFSAAGWILSGMSFPGISKDFFESY